MAVQLNNGRNQFMTAAGAPAVGYKLYAFVAGTSTPKDTWTTSAGDVAHAHPMVLDSRGEVAVYWTGTYDVTMKDAAGATIWGPERLTDSADTEGVTYYGAVGDGVTDDTAAFVAALAAGRVVLVPAGTYKLTSTITLSSFGMSLIGTGGKNTTILSIDHTSGPGVTLAQGQCVIENMTIRASDTRQAYTTGTTYELAADLFGVKLYNAGGSLTQCALTRVVIDRHPNHGIYMGGEGAGTRLIQCESNYNRGHGYAFDDRTIGGGSSSRCGIVTLESCRALDNGGNALHVSKSGSTCYRFIANNLETIWNAWNTSITSLDNVEVYLGGENHKLQQCAFADTDGDARTAMVNGDTRLAKSGDLSTGVFIRSSANNITLELCRYISVQCGVETGTSLGYLRILGGYFTQRSVGGGASNVPTGFTIGNNATNLKIEVPPSTSVTTMVTSDTYNAFPLVINSSLGVQHNFTTTAAFETVMTEDVYMPAGFYRITFCATIQNSTDATTYSARVSLDGVTPSRSYFVSVGVSDFATMHYSFVREVTTAAITTVALQCRQAAGALGSVLINNSTFGSTFVQVERVYQ